MLPEIVKNSDLTNFYFQIIVQIIVEMPTLNFRILPAKALKNNIHFIRLSIAHNGETRYLKTGIFVESIDEFQNGTIVRRPDAALKNAQLRKFHAKIETIIDGMEYINSMSCSELVSHINNTLFGPPVPTKVSDIFYEYISTARIADRSIELSKECFKSLDEYLGPNFNINRVNYSTIMGYEQFLRKKGNSSSTIRTKMAIFSKIIVYARRCKYVPFDFRPFMDYVYPVPPVRESWVTVDDIRQLRDAKIKGTMENVMRDFIMLSYCLGGINIADLLKLDFKALAKTKYLKYIRQKTASQPKVNRYVEFDIPDEAWLYINRLMQKNGKLGSDYQLESHYKDYFAQCVKSLRSQTGIHNLVYYSARKSFAQHAFLLGVPTGVIDYILGHKLDRGGSSLYNYISITPKMATEALRKVLDNLK